MIQLLLEILGWLGYLERPLVLLQLVLAIGPMLLLRWARRQHRRPFGIPEGLLTPAALALLALCCLLLAALRLPYGLTSLLGGLWLGWYGLKLLHPVLLLGIPADQGHRLESRLLRPMFLVIAALALMARVDSLHDLSLIPVGDVLDVTLNIGDLFNAILALYLVLVACGPPAAGLAWLMHQALGISEGSRKAIELILRYLVVGIGLVAVGIHLGLNPTALIAVAGGLSVGLGFGIREVFSNFISGLWLLFEGSVRPGEVLMIDGEPCEVRRLGLRATLLWRDRDNAELLIPNQTFFTQSTTTYTASDRLRRSQVTVGAAYHHDPETVLALLEATALQVPRVLHEPAPKALLISYGDSAIQYALRFWITNPMNNIGICSEVNQAIWRAFGQQGIEIPFPQQVQYSMVWPPEQHQTNTGTP